jgi:hypothetical protein
MEENHRLLKETCCWINHKIISLLRINQYRQSNRIEYLSSVGWLKVLPNFKTLPKAVLSQAHWPQCQSIFDYYKCPASQRPWLPGCSPGFPWVPHRDIALAVCLNSHPTCHCDLRRTGNDAGSPRTEGMSLNIKHTQGHTHAKARIYIHAFTQTNTLKDPSHWAQRSIQVSSTSFHWNDVETMLIQPVCAQWEPVQC